MLTHRNLTFAAESICTYLQNTRDDVILNVLPLSFTYGLGQVTTAFMPAPRSSWSASFTYPRVVLDTMRREQVTGFPLVPTMATLLLQQDLADAPVTAPALHHECCRRAAPGQDAAAAKRVSTRRDLPRCTARRNASAPHTCRRA